MSMRIMPITMTMRNMSMKIMTITMTMRSMNIIMNTMRIAPAAVMTMTIITTMIIITIMQMKCLPAGDSRLPPHIPQTKSPIFWKNWIIRTSTDLYFVQKAWFPGQTVHGHTSIMYRKRAMYVPAAPVLPVRFVSLVQI